MLTNFILSISRNMLRHWKLNTINIIGFSIGIASCLIIGNFVLQENLCDKHHANYERIYRVCLDRIYPDRSVLWAPIAPGVRDGLLESNQIVDAVRVSSSPVVLLNDKGEATEENGIFTDSSFFKVFTTQTIAGDVKESINDPSSAIITEAFAKKYFRDQSPLGNVIRIDHVGEFKIGAVIEDCPKHSHMKYDVILSLQSNHTPEQLTIWGSAFGYYTYVLLGKNTSAESLERDYFPKMADKYLGTEEDYKSWRASGNQYRYFLQPLEDIHLHSNLKWEMNPNGNYVYVNLFMWVGIMIQVIACINFTNLSSARFSTRLKEVGIRKVMGSFRRQIIVQFLLESVTLSIIAMFFALVIVQVSMPSINALTNSHLEFYSYPLPWMIGALLSFTLIVGLVAGLYPAIMLSAYKPVLVLNNNSSTTSVQSGFRDYLVVTQFIISFFLIAGTFVIYQQINFFKSKDLGFSKDHILIIDNARDIQNKETFKEELLKNPDILSVSYSADIPGRMQGASTYQKKSGPYAFEVNMTILHGDLDLFKTWNLKLKEGREFVFTDFGDTVRNVILNETAVKQLGLQMPVVGSELLDQGKNTLTVVGVLKDFHTESLHKEIRPLMLFAGTRWVGTVSVKIKGSGNSKEAMAHVEAVWHKYVPQKAVALFFLDDFYNSLYVAEELIGKLSIVFTALAILLACLGLYGLSAFAAEQKTKEIGIRKVLGATTWSIIQLFLQQTNKLVLVSICVAIPITHYLSVQWLQGFAYRTNIDVLIYFLSAIALIAIAVLTVLFHSYKAARLNPADSLKTQ